MTTHLLMGASSEEESREWQLIYAALKNPRWDFRTIEGIATETGLAPEAIEREIAQHSSVVRQSDVPDRKGRALYTLSSRVRGWREIAANVSAYISKVP